MSRKKKNQKHKMPKKDKVIIIISMIIFVLCMAGIIVYYLFYNGDKSLVKKKENKKITIIDENSNQRPIAVMIDNNTGYDVQAGLQEAYLNYEIIVEGGYTRIMSLFKDRNVELIGPVRSARHYFLDYAMESDAIYAHYGWSTYAENDIKSLKINNVNGLTSESAYWRDNTLPSPHNVYTNIDTLYKYAKDKKYSITTDDWKLLNYSTDEINLNATTLEDSSDNKTNSDVIVADNVSIKYSNNQTTSYKYDSKNKYYLRYMDSNVHLDKTTKKQLHYKNVIIQKVENYDLDSYGRQNLNTVNNGEGFYITNGYARPIVWEKTVRKGKTSYKYLDGSQVKVNDGNTFIQIIPLTTTPEIS